MPLVLADRVKETTTTTGTGTITLDGAATGFQSFSVIGNGNTTYYTIAGQGTNEWEVGIGTYTSAGTKLSRDVVLASSAGAPTKTTFSSGIKDVFVTYPAGKAVYEDASDDTSLPGSLTFLGTAKKILGDFSNGTVSNRLNFQTSTVNSATGIYALPNGTSTAASWQATNNSDPTNASKILIATNGSTDVQLVSGRNGTGTYLPLTFYTGGSERFRYGISGQFGIAGANYGNSGDVFVSGGASAAPSWTAQSSLSVGNAATVTGITNNSGFSGDINTLTTSGFYRLNPTMTNGPTGDYGQLLVIHGGSDTITQIYGDFATGQLQTRSGNPPNVGGAGTWQSWRYLLDTSGATFTGNLTMTGTITASSFNGNASNGVPPGTVISFAASTAPTGYLKANGAAVSRSTYAALFSAIGTTFGAGDGSTTFNVPDLRGYFVRGWDDGRGVDSGRAFGSSQEQNISNHKHELPFYLNYTNGDLRFNTASSVFGTGSSFTVNRLNGSNLSSSGTSSYTLTNDQYASSVSGDNRPVNTALLACIKF